MHPYNGNSMSDAQLNHGPFILEHYRNYYIQYLQYRPTYIGA